MTCAIIGCRNTKRRKQENLGFHSFPKDEAMRKKWVEAVRGKIRPNANFLSRICSAHFEKKDLMILGKRMNVNTYGVPSIFPSIEPFTEGKISSETDPLAEDIQRAPDSMPTNNTTTASSVSKAKLAPSMVDELKAKLLLLQLTLKKKNDTILGLRKQVIGLQQNKRRMQKRITSLTSILRELASKRFGKASQDGKHDSNLEDDHD